MMKWLHLLPCLLLAAVSPVLHADDAASELVPNGDFEADSEKAGWPDGWGKGPGMSYQVDDAGKHFLRLVSESPGQTVMIYRLVPIPEGTKAVEIAIRYRTDNVKRGAQAWYDARVMLDFLGDKKNRLEPAPRAMVCEMKTADWVDMVQRCVVPAGTKNLQLMPALFQAASGTLDLAQIRITALGGSAADEIAKQAADAAQKAVVAAPQVVQPQTSTGSLIPNGSFEAGEGGVPKDWGLAAGITWEQEEGNHFLRLQSPEPGKMILAYRSVVLPLDAKALALTCRMRVSNLKAGEKPWFDARVMMNFKNAKQEVVNPGPEVPNFNTNTKGWVSVSKRFLVPEGAVTLEVMPTLFQVKTGTLDLDDLSLTAVDPEAVKAEIAERAPPPAPPQEEAMTEKWPSVIHVAGNQLQTADGQAVWLQGVNVISLEWTVPGENVRFAAKTAIEDWKANFIRLPVSDKFWFGKGPTQSDGGEAYRAFVDSVIIFAANRGARVLLDLHNFHAPRDKDVVFWKDAAARYKNHPAVLFDIFNEPHSVSWEVWRNGGWVDEKKAPADEDNFLSPEERAKAAKGFQSPGMQALVTAIRETGANNVIAAGGLDWAYDLSGIVNGYALTDTKDGNGIMYSTHIYNWKTGWEDKVLKTAAKYPIVVGECGADVHKMDFMPANIQEAPETWVPDMLGLIQKYKLNWTGWCLHPGATPVMISNWKFIPTPFWGAPAKEALAGKQYELKKLR